MGQHGGCYKLQRLPDEDCWSIFQNQAMTKDLDAGLHQAQIVKKCGGLPLAARTLGGLLRTKPVNEWEHILNSRSTMGESSIVQVLRLSYHHLPIELKRCFAYCAIFPQDYSFTEKELVQLWIAEGFVQPAGENQPFETIGGNFFHELVSRSLFEASGHQGSNFVMHGLVHELAEWAAGETCFHFEHSNSTEQHQRSEKARHSSYSRGRSDGIKKFEAFREMKRLRTFLPLPINCKKYYPADVYYIAPGVLTLLPKLKTLRILSFAGYEISELPDSIGELKHLRYFNLSHTKIKSLPESTCSLYNLQYLILSYCSHLRKLPSKMENLINLSHLDITNVDLLEGMPTGLKELKSLEILPMFVLEKGKGYRISELMNFKLLRGTLCISNLENVMDVRDAMDAQLSTKQGLDSSVLKWSSNFDDSRNPETEKAVLNVLKPHQNLGELTIQNYGGVEFPLWLGDSWFSNMTFLRLEKCENCMRLPSLGQLSHLKKLIVKSLKEVKDIGAEFCGSSCSKPFPSLETLHFEDMAEWVNWNSSGVSGAVEIYPCLSELSIIRCPKLCGKLPDPLPSLEALTIQECKQLVVSVSGAPKLWKLNTGGFDEEVVNKSKIDLCSLREFQIGKSCEEMICRGIPHTLEILKLQGCDRIETLPDVLRSLKFLRELYILDCTDLVSLSSTIFASNLQTIRIEKCSNLQTLENAEEDDMSMGSGSLTPQLKWLVIEECPSLRCLSSKGMLPSSLTSLRIRNCKQLESISETIDNNTCLQIIILVGCVSLESLPKGLHNISHLRYFCLSECTSLASLPEGGLPTTNLRDLVIYDCEKLEAQLPYNLTFSLHSLWIQNCPGIVFIPKEEEEGLLANITGLWVSVSGINITKPLTTLLEWKDFHKLTSLQHIGIGGDGFPDMDKLEMKLPTSLTTLGIDNFTNLKYISSDFFHNLTSLECLYIYKCPKLESLPKVGLPPSLLRLYINDCPLLAKQCQRKNGRYWSKISHLPLVQIDDKSVYDRDGA